MFSVSHQLRLSNGAVRLENLMCCCFILLCLFFQEKLGIGSYSVVHKCINRETKEECAVKVGASHALLSSYLYAVCPRLHHLWMKNTQYIACLLSCSKLYHLAKGSACTCAVFTSVILFCVSFLFRSSPRLLLRTMMRRWR